MVARFDRDDGHRTHQEDLKQALGIATRDKYESSSNERCLRPVAVEAGAEARSPARLVADLLTQVAFNLIIGNGDAHSKNYSLAIDDAEETVASVATAVRDALPVVTADRIDVPRIAGLIDARVRAALQTVDSR